MYLLTNKNADGTYSVKDTISDITKHYTDVELQHLNMPVVGIFRNPSTGLIVDAHKAQPKAVSAPYELFLYKPKNNSYAEMDKTFIFTPEIRNFVEAALRWVPEYIFHVPASITGYHPDCNLGEGGLARHTIFVARNLKYIVELESTKKLFGIDQIKADLMMVACIFHDSLKDGWEYDIEKGKHLSESDKVVQKKVYFEHPLRAANAIRGMVGFLPQDMLEFIAHCIESHMGQWNTANYAPGVVLPYPDDIYRWLVHIADFMASRKGLEMKGLRTYTCEKPEEENKLKNKIPLSQEDFKLIFKYVEEKKPIDPKLKASLGINNDDKVCIDILNSIMKYQSVTEKQAKYLELVRRSSNKSANSYHDILNLNTNDILMLQGVSVDRKKIPAEYKVQLGINRSDDECYVIFENLINRGNASPKMKKYFELAKKLHSD